MLDVLITIRNIFYRLFFMGFIYILVASLVYAFKPDFFIGMVEYFYKLDKPQAVMLISLVIVFARLFVLFGMLFPALAIHWTIASLKKKSA